MTQATAVSLFAPYQLGPYALQNRVAMAPMTRSRAIGNVPNALMAEYYAQRAGAGLIISEGVSPSPNGLGYARIPGLFNPEQVAGWKLVTEAVHARGGRIFAQLMHTGRVGHPANMPAGSRILAPSAITLPGEMWTDEQGMQPHPQPTAMTLDDIQAAIAEHAQAAKLAVEAGFDGVELHGANGYLIEQFLNPASNQRTDAYGGTAENRLRFAREVAEATVAAIGGDRVGMRLSPHSAFNGMDAEADLDDAYVALASYLSELGLLYLHIADNTADAIGPLKQRLREAFRGAVVLAGNYDAERAQADLAAGKADLIAFGRPFVANPNLVAKLQSGAELRQPDRDTLYAAGAEGFVDYPAD